MRGIWVEDTALPCADIMHGIAKLEAKCPFQDIEVVAVGAPVWIGKAWGELEQRDAMGPDFLALERMSPWFPRELAKRDACIGHTSDIALVFLPGQ